MATTATIMFLSIWQQKNVLENISRNISQILIIYEPRKV
jgi:hypothetical protein